MRGLSDHRFESLSRFIHEASGIKMPSSKRSMLEARLQKRLRTLGIEDFDEYWKILRDPRTSAEELPRLLEAMTTNTTEFFREPNHFEFMNKVVLPEFVHPGLEEMHVWSAGCSSGEEPYTLAMVLDNYARKVEPFRFSILATDLCSDVLAKAKRAVYPEDRLASVPHDFKKAYFLRSKDREAALTRVVPELRAQIRFAQLNFMESMPSGVTFQIIFCRNVMIYFERKTQFELLTKFCHRLIPGGYLFIGHSESLAGLELPLTQVAPTIYRHAGGKHG